MTPTKNDTTSPRVSRGGSLIGNEPSWLSAASCFTRGPASRGGGLGFRTSLPARQPR